ncbi:gamma-glutamylcyclotransferase family protein [Haloferula sargassicola]|uniref:Gamma-glutamylcyclotransferase family protein n=1 Tax=Haloferula sargassicola TaxID=490096 RepID=A0ABP9US01_9BACT
MNDVVWVYGTLRRGASNGHRMEGAEYLGPAAVHGRLFLIDTFRDFAYPALIPDADAGLVVGDAFSVPPQILAGLDDFEGEEYDRVKLSLIDPTTGKEHSLPQAWAYVWNRPVEDRQIIAGGDWIAAYGAG